MSARSDCTEFGPFRLFPAERQLLKGETPVQIGSREFDILLALVERAGEVVTKRELFARVWPDVVVEESSLRVHVAGLRKVLADGHDQARYIVNVPGRGYSFVASLSGAVAPASHAWAGAPPQRSTRIIGRDNDISAIAALIAEHRFVTIHGPGGVGKTTLGLAIASAHAHAFADGVCFVDLSLNIGVHSVADALASALELIARARDPTAAIVDFIRAREMLLVLDSCETTIGDAAALAESIIHEAPGVAVLATSREPLRAQSEHVYPLEPLSFPPEGVIATASDLLVFSAAQLFCERAVAGGYRAELKDADAVIVGDICRRVDGNALALELAASRISTYGLRQTADLLDSHMKLTWRGRRTAPPRHQTLTAMLDWSYALIDERERDVLRQLSVFVGGFGLDEARGVAGESDEVIEALEQLVLKSLVAVDTSGQKPRYRLLDTTRAYASVKLRETGMVGEVRRRHARYYLDWLTRSTDVAAAPVEHTANIRAALEWAFSNEGDAEIGLGLATYACELFLRLGMLTESRRWSERGLESLSPERGGSLQEMALQAAIGHATMITAGSTGAAREALERALRIAEELGDPLHQFRLLNSMHSYHRRIGAVDELLPIAEHAARIAPRLGGIAPIVAAQGMLGLAHHLKGNLTAPHRYLTAVRDAQLGASAVTNFYGFHRAAEVLIARTLWLLGYPDQAAQAERDA
ncbi:MAG TPA: winged helix-turn-helix domain-containing protein, partial [Steroidobacter sp.]|nr:winged helix-turn-helix domain-containing protein [Steroidobacter sp.]